MPRTLQLTTLPGGRLTPLQQSSVVDVLYEGFERKIKHLLLHTGCETQAKRMLPKLVDFSQSLIACDGDEVCGVLFLNRGRRKCFRFDWPLAVREFGLFGALLRRVNYWIVHEKSRKADELNIQAISVREDRRCQGVGSELIHAAEDIARSEGFHELSLEVVDSNPRAKNLYQRLGFETKKTERTWPFTTRAGFKSVDSMSMRVSASQHAPCESRVGFPVGLPG